MTAPTQHEPQPAPPAPTPTPAPAPREPESSRGYIDEIAYVAPMAAFLVLVWVGTTWKGWYAAAYVARTAIVPVLLIGFWRYYTRISWRFAWLGVLVGVIGIVQWVGMQLWLQNHFERFKPDPDPFNPFAHFGSPAAAWAFVAVRVIGAVLIVPVMEELFWRDYLWRQILAPNDFKLAKVGEFEWSAFLIIPIVFATVHGNWWPTAIVWALMIGALLVYTKSLGACILAHAVTNLLLAGYVLVTKDWSFW
jgi:CAAX prenyl protease-like protein